MRPEEIRKAVKPYVPGWVAAASVITYPEYWQGWLGNFQVYDANNARLSWTYNVYAVNKSGLDIYLAPAAAVSGWYAIIDIPLHAGTYRFLLMRRGTTGSGKFDIYVDGTKVSGATPLDAYEDPENANRAFTVTGITIAAGGLHTFKILNVGKTVSSSDYCLNGSYVGIDRTG